jgi:hypothetical protein
MYFTKINLFVARIYGLHRVLYTIEQLFYSLKTQNALTRIISQMRPEIIQEIYP